LVMMVLAAMELVRKALAAMKSSVQRALLLMALAETELVLMALAVMESVVSSEGVVGADGVCCCG